MADSNFDLGAGYGGEVFPGMSLQAGLPRPKTPEEAAKLEPGTKFLDPSGTQRTVPYRPKTALEAATLPEGSLYVDPKGQIRQIPMYQDVGFTANTLYDMAATDSERKKALEHSYPGKVKKNEVTGDYYVDDNGTLRKPRGFTGAPGSFLASQAAPFVGSLAGELGGAAAGTAAAPGVGTFAGAVGGGAAGAAAGQAFNDSMLWLAGIYDRSKGQEAFELGGAAAAGGIGTGVGRGIAAVAPAIKGFAKNALPKMAANFLGAIEPETRQALALQEKGVLVRPSAHLKEAPHVHLMVERYDPTFHTQKPLEQSAIKYYEKEAGELLKSTGAKIPEGKLSEPAAAVSGEAAGTALIRRAHQQAAETDAKLQIALEKNRVGVAATANERGANIEMLRQADAQARTAADKVIAEGFSHIQAGIDQAAKTAKVGLNSGQLWTLVAQKLRTIRTAIGARAKVRYREADALAAGHLPNITNVTDRASDLLVQMPEGFEREYPDIVRRIRDLAGTRDENTGEWVKEPARPTFGELHELRTALRTRIKHYDLTPDFTQGALKHIEDAVNASLHADETPELAAAAMYLDATDKWYGKAIGPLTDKRIQAVVDGISSGMPADAKELYNVVVREGRSDLTNKVRKMVGPALWNAVKAADVQSMLDAAKTLTPGQIDGKAFIRQVLDRVKSGMLAAVHGNEGSRLLEQAQRIDALNGSLPLPVREGDTINEIINRAIATKNAAAEAAKRDPLSTLNKEMKGIQSEHNRAMAKLQKERQADPLGFLYKPTIGANEAVDKILRDEDLIHAAAVRFGENSPEFQMLRQVWTQRILAGTLRPGARLEKFSPEIQALMLPGVSLEAMQTLAKNMDFLMGHSDLGGSMAGGMSAMSKVTHPFSGMVGGTALGSFFGGPAGGAIGGAVGLVAAPMARAVLGTFYGFLREMVNKPAFTRFILKGLKGDEAAREMVKKELVSRMRAGGAIGAAAGTALFTTPNRRTLQ